LQALPAAAQLSVHGTAFHLDLPGGRVLHSPELVGATLLTEIEGRPARVRIDAVEPEAAPDEPLWLHALSVQSADGAWRPFCAPDPQGRALGFPLAGRSRANGSFDASDASRFELVCTAGAQGKCVRYGYAPWARTTDGTSLRADYAADGTPATRDGIPVGSTDRWGVRAMDPPRADEAFEAGWDAQGAVCVHHLRVADGRSLAELEARVPRLKGKTGAVCTPEFARAGGALIFNWSRR
jgi:hypothetical protein